MGGVWEFLRIPELRVQGGNGGYGAMGSRGGKTQASHLSIPTPIRTILLLHTLCCWDVAPYFVQRKHSLAFLKIGKPLPQGCSWAIGVL